MRNMHILRVLALLGISCLALVGCSNRSPAPVEQENIAYYQLQSQAVEHWRDMAVDVAERVRKAVNDRPDLINRPIFIAQPNNEPFTVAFYNLLRTEIVSRGMQVAYEREPSGVLLEYTAQLVPFDPSRGSVPEHELVVNARMQFNNRYVMHCSSVRYINDGDIALYGDPQVTDPKASGSRNIRVTRK